MVVPDLCKVSLTHSQTAEVSASGTEEVRRLDEALRAVADPTRRAILRLVRDDELPAGEIARHFPSMSRPAVSQHLRVLADAGLVDVRPEGNRRHYRWRREGLRDAATFLEEMWTDRLARLKAAAEREEWPARARAAREARRASRKETSR
jgi:DNA-binding transcriptional ArsR family regulator